MADTTPAPDVPHDRSFDASASHPAPLVISCDTCVMAQTSACDDCVMAVLCPAEEPRAVVLDLAERRALRLLADAGMVPTLRHRATG
jgi:hypothetical protein